MRKLFASLMFACLSVLVGCNGSSGENDGDSSPIAARLVLVIENSSGESQQSFNADEDVALIATLYDEEVRLSPECFPTKEFPEPVLIPLPDS